MLVSTNFLMYIDALLTAPYWLNLTDKQEHTTGKEHEIFNILNNECLRLLCFYIKVQVISSGVTSPERRIATTVCWRKCYRNIPMLRVSHNFSRLQPDRLWSQSRMIQSTGPCPTLFWVITSVNERWMNIEVAIHKEFLNTTDSNLSSAE